MLNCHSKHKVAPTWLPWPQALSYSVKGTGGQQLHLLDNITGVFPKGEMCALMGASGSGKSTLLDLLAGRKTQVEMQGVLLMDGQRPTKQFLRRYVGYVEQQGEHATDSHAAVGPCPLQPGTTTGQW